MSKPKLPYTNPIDLYDILCQRIAFQLSYKTYEQMTEAEQNIAILLTRAGYLEETKKGTFLQICGRDYKETAILLKDAITLDLSS